MKTLAVLLVAGSVSWALPLVSPPAYSRENAPAKELRFLRNSEYSYYISHPKGWAASKKWPLLVVLEGSGHRYQKRFNLFVKERGDLPFIVVAPCLPTDGGDSGALYAIVRQVQAQDSGQERIFLTGYSSGGILTSRVILDHPELLAGAAPASSSFNPARVRRVSQAPERATLPVRAFYGATDKDLPIYFEQQWKGFEALLRKNGYGRVDHQIVAGNDHSAFAPQIVAFFASLLPRD